jgi:peptidoglycan/LPS O-acetylase OafA/YrhL
MSNALKRVPSLDGLRAVSVMLVIISHVFLRVRGHGVLATWLLALAGNGTVGVSIFFVISGFLITMLLIKEEVRYGSISLKDFYIRRAFRILPAFLAYVGVIWMLTATGTLDVQPRQFIRALTFTMDYGTGGSWYLGHMWSLSVEEQFYLIWPLIVVLLSQRALKRIALAVIVLGPFIRMADRILLPSTKSQIEYMGHTRADMLMFGCLVALLFDDDRFQVFLDKLDALKAPILCSLFLFLGSPTIELWLGGTYIKTLGYTLQGMSICVVMLYLIRHPETFSGKLFNTRIAIHIGTLSYSLYLWQELFFGPRDFKLRFIAMSFAFTFVAAEISFNLIEKPMLRLKRRFEHERVAGARIREAIPEASLTEP